MNEQGQELEEEGLDPDDWEAMRRLGYRMIDDVVAMHRDIGTRPAWEPPSQSALQAIHIDVPRSGIGEEAAYAELAQHVLPYPYGNIHPRHWGWVNGTGTTLGAFVEMMAAAMNSNCWGGNHSAVEVEVRVLEWLKEMIGLDAGCSGILLSGASEANLVALAAARDAATGAPADGIQRRDAPLVAYCSTETHNSVAKSISLLGLGAGNLRAIAVDDSYRLDISALRARIHSDRAAEMQPFCVVATAGTVNTGAIDPLDALADLCRDERMWLHVDGAFGVVAAISPVLRPLLNGVTRADSVSFDLHKWLYMPIEAAVVMIRSAADHTRPFAAPASYLTALERGIASGPHVFSDRGPQLTRAFRAAKVWMSLLAFGVDRYARLVEQNVRQAQHLAALVSAAAHLELMAPVPLNVVCFRYVHAQLGAGDADRFNRELLMRIQESGVAAPSGTMIRGRAALRCAITNHRTRMSDLHALVDAVERIGGDMMHTHEVH